MMKKPFSLLMAALMVLPTTAHRVKAEEGPEVQAETWSDVRNAPSGSTVVLNSDVDAEEGMTVSGNLTVDLNGHTITQKNGSVFTVTENGNLTVKDSQSVQETVLAASSDISGQSASVSDSAISYYVTTSYVSDEANGTTTESTEKHDVTLNGRIQATENNPLIQVSNGTFNLGSGTLLGQNDSNETRGIQVNGGTINLTGGYIAGFNQNDVKKKS